MLATGIEPAWSRLSGEYYSHFSHTSNVWGVLGNRTLVTCFTDKRLATRLRTPLEAGRGIDPRYKGYEPERSP